MLNVGLDTRSNRKIPNRTANTINEYKCLRHHILSEYCGLLCGSMTVDAFFSWGIPVVFITGEIVPGFLIDKMLPHFIHLMFFPMCCSSDR